MVVNPELLQAVRIVLGSTRSMGLDAVLVGALASELAASEEPEVSVARGTLDADFALHLRNWDEFGALKKKLVDSGFLPDPKIEHRLYLGKNSMIDLIPYGPEIARDGELLWPVSQKSMVVVGFDEACARTVESSLDATLAVKRITIAGFALLKTIAFLDRRAAGHPKYRSDADDLMFWFRNYASGKEEGRKYELVDHGVTDVDFLDAGAAVLGIDVAALASEAADLRVRTFLGLTVDLFGPFLNAVVTPGFDENRPRVHGLCKAFRKGYEAARDGS
jgi:predicted nucleotidyltransferase